MSANDTPSPQIERILRLMGTFAGRLESLRNDFVTRWLPAHCDDPRLQRMMPRLTLLMMRVLDATERAQRVNGQTVSQLTGIPKGSVSKIARRLEALGLLSRDRRPDNKKEVIFRVTADGTTLVQLNRVYDEEMKAKLVSFMRRYDGDTLSTVISILKDVEAEWFPTRV